MNKPMWPVLRKRLQGWRRRVATSRELSRLRALPHPQAHVIAALLSDWMNRVPLQEPMISTIEAQRSQWLKTDGSNAEADAAFNDKQTIARACQASKPPIWAELLFRLVRGAGARSVLELGTNLGISSAYLAVAARENRGSVVTMEGSEPRLELARAFHRDLDLNNIDYVFGRFRKTLPELLKEGASFDFAFIDGHHQYRATLDYLDWIRPRLADGAVVVFDDITWSDGMVKAWGKLRADRRFAFVVDIGSVGIAVIRRSPEARPPETFRFHRPAEKST